MYYRFVWRYWMWRKNVMNNELYGIETGELGDNNETVTLQEFICFIYTKKKDYKIAFILQGNFGNYCSEWLHDVHKLTLRKLCWYLYR